MILSTILCICANLQCFVTYSAKVAVQRFDLLTLINNLCRTIDAISEMNVCADPKKPTHCWQMCKVGNDRLSMWNPWQRRKSSCPKVNLEGALLIQREAKRVSKSVSEVETVDLGEVAKVVHAQDEDDRGQGSRDGLTSLPQTLSQVGHHGRENGEPRLCNPAPPVPPTQPDNPQKSRNPIPTTHQRHSPDALKLFKWFKMLQVDGGAPAHVDSGIRVSVSKVVYMEPTSNTAVQNQNKPPLFITDQFSWCVVVFVGTVPNDTT